MKNISVMDIILAAWWAYLMMRLINLFKVKERLQRLFSKKDNNRLPVDYDCVYSQLDAQVKRLARKYDINLKFKINETHINSDTKECHVSFFGENYSHEFSFGFFNNIKNLSKKTHVSAIKYLVLKRSSDLEDKLLNFIILDKLRSLERNNRQNELTHDHKSAAP